MPDPSPPALPRPRDSIRWKWVAGSLLLSALVSILIGGVTLWSLRRDAFSQTEKSLAAEAALAADLFRGPLSEGAPDGSIDRLADRVGREIHARVTVLRVDGAVAGDSSEGGPDLLATENLLRRPEVESALLSGTGTSIRFSETARKETFYLAARIESGGKPVGIVRLARPMDEIYASVGRIQDLLLFAFAAALLGALFFSRSVSRRLTDRLAALTEAAQAIARGEFHHRVRVRSQDEVGRLGEALNRMSEDLEGKIGLLSEDRAKTLAILAGMAEGVLVLDAEGKIVLTNASFEKMFGLNGSEAIGHYYYERLRHHSLNDLVEQVLKERKPLSRDLRLEIGLRPHLHAQASITEGTPPSVVLVFHDISEIKRLERARKDFVANVSHELRTPLAAIKGYLETLAEGGLEPDQTKEFLTILQRHTARMESIVRDLLQLSRIESGLDPVRPLSLPVKEIVDKQLFLYQPLAEKNRKSLSVEVPPGLQLWADPEKANLVFANLLDNAVKYTPEGGRIVLRAFDDGRHTVVQVEDTGIGIPREDLPRIFERFYRVDRTRSRQLGGTGLGLSIVKHVMEAHGGSITVESEIGKGTRFIAAFPKESEAA